MSDGYLFSGPDLTKFLSDHGNSAAKEVNAIPEEQFRISSDKQVLEHIKPKFFIEPLVLDVANATFSQRETLVPTIARFKGFSLTDSVNTVPGTEILISIPYSGADGLWKHTTNPTGSIKPRAEFYNHRNPKVLVIVIALPGDADKSAFKNRYDRTLELVQSYIGYSTAQVTGFNRRLERNILKAIEARRQHLQRHEGIAQLLDIPLKKRVEAPDTQPVRLEIRMPRPLPNVPSGSTTPEPGLTNIQYEMILNVLRHEGCSFEASPATFKKLAEEELRDVLLSHLNLYFVGGAAGEAFRKKGKTDILIQMENRSAFVCECKIWSGVAGAINAVDQLLNYLTWRDSKAALIFFNMKIASFSSLPNKLHQALLGHPQYVSDMQCGKPNELRVVMRSREDAGRRITVHAFLFDLYIAPTSNKPPRRA